MDFYFRQMWKDPRLRFNATHGIKTLSVSTVHLHIKVHYSFEGFKRGIETGLLLQVGTEFLQSIWVPDTFFGEVTVL